MNLAHRLLTLLALVLLPSCNRDMLSVYTDYITIEDLASYYVSTPDPFLNRPPFGQRLNVSWSIPNRYFSPEDTNLLLTIRFCNRDQITKRIVLRRSSGSYIFCLNRQQYCAKGGILTYKVQLMSSGCFLEEWKHQLWAELIAFEPPEDDESEFDIESIDIDPEKGEIDIQESDTIEFID